MKKIFLLVTILSLISTNAISGEFCTKKDVKVNYYHGEGICKGLGPKSNNWYTLKESTTAPQESNKLIIKKNVTYVYVGELRTESAQCIATIPFSHSEFISIEQCDDKETNSYTKTEISTHFSLGNGSFSSSNLDYVSAAYWDDLIWNSSNFTGKESSGLQLIYNAKGSKIGIWSLTSQGDGGYSHQNSDHLLGVNSWDSQRFLTGDVNADGKKDIIRISDPNNTTAYLSSYISNGSGTYTSLTTNQSLAADFWPDQNWLSADINNDDSEDIVLIYGDKNNKANIWVYTSNKNGTFTKMKNQKFGAGFWNSQHWKSGDINGDGADDIVLIYGDANGKTKVWVYQSNLDGSFTRVSTQSLGANFWSSQVWKLGDIDGNGSDDLVLIYGAADGKARIWTYMDNGRNQFIRKSANKTLTPFSNKEGTTPTWILGDVNGDHKDDIIKLIGSN